MASQFDTLKDIDLTRDEVEKIGDALKDKEFRKLLAEYVEEIQDPENKKLYQEEITQLEKERGFDVTFINPDAGYVIKTSADGNKKAFINICTNENIEKPTSKSRVQNGSKGLHWSLPHSLTPPREDVDRKGIRCQVFDVVFHPDTLYLAKNNKAFRNMVNNTACDAIESNFGVRLDVKNLKFPKMQYKGMAHAAVIRKEAKSKPDLNPEEQELMNKLYENVPKVEVHEKVPNKSKAKEGNNSKYTTPNYIIKHRKCIELDEFTENKMSKVNCAIPKELVVEVNLPLLKSANDIVLDVMEKTIELISEKPSKYKLFLTLPYVVDQNRGNAKFDKDTKKLIIILPVQRGICLLDINRDDSGVESDHGSPALSPSETFDKPRSEIGSDFRTKTTFLEPDTHYSLPDFTCNLFENTLAFTLHIKNVDSLSKSIETNSIHLKLSTISSGFYPVHYAFYVKLQEHTINNDITLETWDNNVILQLPFEPCDKILTEYLVGIDENHLEKKFIQDPSIVNDTLNTIDEDEKPVNVESTENETCSEIETYPISDVRKFKLRKNYKKSKSSDNGDGVFDERNATSKAIDIIGAISESSGDELSYSYSPSKCRGILKRLSTSRSSGSRSISESSIDDVLWASSFENCTSLDSVIPEDGEVSTSFKKTVRFNDVVLKQLYRSNSSILGQKKKNQRKARNKKRAQERRHSESELSEIEDRKERDLTNTEEEEEDEEEEEEDDNDNNGAINEAVEKKKADIDIFDLDI